jgi:dihydroorotase
MMISMNSKIKYDLILKNGNVVLPEGIQKTDIGVINESISNIGDLSNADAKKNIDCSGLHVLPGVIDSQVHFREPGLENKENLESGMLAAAAGGVTAVFEMPNTDPLTITPETIKDKLQRASRVAWTDYAFYLGGTGRTGPNLDKWEMLREYVALRYSWEPLQVS